MAASINGFDRGGRAVVGTARGMAPELSRAAAAAAMVPVCPEMARTGPERAARIWKASRRRGAPIEAGRPTVPGADAPGRDIALASVAATAGIASPDAMAGKG
ncbi:hypothetical protein [Mangrovicoccus sp. HB161399]|uniref:hypothetical protein n=1 Tax=Mangrovicoccus sp. HB161399 TaxID=2720392 RepID=UPI00352E2B68